MNASHSSPADAPWTEFVPEDAQPGGPWRANSYKRAIARTSDHLRKLIEDHGDERTMFVIMGDHGHTEPGGAGGAADEVRIVPLFAYQKGSNLGQKAESARMAAGTAAADSPRFVAKARELSEARCRRRWRRRRMGATSSMDGTVQEHQDEWRDDGTYAVDIIDTHRRHVGAASQPPLGVFIDDIVGGITTDQGPAAASMLGKGCTGREVAWESPVYNGIRGLADCMCNNGPSGSRKETGDRGAVGTPPSRGRKTNSSATATCSTTATSAEAVVRPWYLEAVDALRVWRRRADDLPQDDGRRQAILRRRE